MKVRHLFASMLFILLTVGTVQASVDSYVGDLNIYASKQFSQFRVELSARYGISGAQFDKLLRKVDSPGDLAVSLWIGYKAQKPVNDVIKQYRLRRGQGWGVIAKEVGINPGSTAFKQLKEGEINWHPKDFDTVVKRPKEKDKAKMAEESKEVEREQRIKEKQERKEKKRREWEQKQKESK